MLELIDTLICGFYFGLTFVSLHNLIQSRPSPQHCR